MGSVRGGIKSLQSRALRWGTADDNGEQTGYGGAQMPGQEVFTLFCGFAGSELLIHMQDETE